MKDNERLAAGGDGRGAMLQSRCDDGATTGSGRQRGSGQDLTAAATRGSHVCIACYRLCVLCD